MRLAAILLLALLLPGCAVHNEPLPQHTAQQTVAVRPGETVYDVAKRLNIAVRDLIDANRLLPPYRLAPGQTLVVPVPNVYTVAKGDSLYAIARRFNVDQNSIAQTNHLTAPYKIFVGQQLQMPNYHGVSGQETPSLEVAQQPAAPPPDAPEQPVSPSPRAVEATPLGAPAALARTDISSPTALAPPAAASSGPVVAGSGPAGAPSGFVWPVRGEVVSGFGPKPGGLHNDGINIAAAEGTPVKSAGAGAIAYAGDELRGFGNLILIRHADGWVTAYAHLASMAVKKGDAVKAGQVIGAVGQTGSIDSPQLHFELRHGKDAIDPAGKLSG